MEIGFHNILLFGSILLIISVFTSKTSYKIGMPTLIMFLLVGMLAGNEGLGGVNFSSLKDAQFIGTVSLIFILYSGGLDTKKENIQPVLTQGIILSIFGVLFTAASVGFFVYYVTDFTFAESMLLASIVSSTDAASVFSIFRSRNIGIDKHISATLELESGSNDPAAYLLTITFLNLIISPSGTGWEIVFSFVQSLVLGAVFGVLFGYLTVFIINKINLDIDGLYPVLVVGLALLTFAATDYINGNGYLAVYIAAIILSNNDFVHKRSIIRIYDGINWFAQIVMFIVLGLLVNPSELIPVMGLGLLISAFMIFIARPAVVFLCLTPLKINFKHQALISWVGLRGAVPIILATYPLAAGIQHANTIFNIVFFIAVTSIIFQGMTIPQVAKALKLIEDDAPHEQKIDFEKYEKSISQIAEIIIDPNCSYIGKSIMQLAIPKEVLIVMIHRNGNTITPNGSTILHPLDKLLIVSDSRHSIEEVKKNLGGCEVLHKVKKQRLISKK